MHLAVVGGSDAGIEAARRCRELNPSVEVTVLLADAYPNLSICGLPYWHSREVPRWQDLAHRTVADLEATGMRLLANHEVTSLDLDAGTLAFTDHGVPGALAFDRLILATGAVPARPAIRGLHATSSNRPLGAEDGLHLLHTMPDAFALDTTITRAMQRSGSGGSAVVVGAGYVGLEMADALTARGLRVVVLEQMPQVLPRTLDPGLAALVEAHLSEHGVDVRTDTRVDAVERSERDTGHGPPLRVQVGNEALPADLILIATGVRPATDLAVAAGLKLGAGDAIAVDRQMRTSADGVWAAGDCVHTHHRLTGTETYLPLGTTAHKQGRVAGENVLGGSTEYTGSLGTQAVKIFDRVAAATGFRDSDARAAGFDSVTVGVTVDDHKRYYPGATDLALRLTADRQTGQLLGGQLVGAHGAEVSKRVDVLAAAIHSGLRIRELGDLDLSYSPPLSAPWDALQQAAHTWISHANEAHSEVQKEAGL